MTHAEVAYVLGLSIVSVSRMRRGKQGASLRTVYNLSETYGLDVYELILANRERENGHPEKWIALFESVFGRPQNKGPKGPRNITEE